MAFSVTLRVNSNSGTTSAGSRTSGSFTPTAHSRLFVFAVGERDDHLTARNWQISDSQSLSWTKLDESTLTNWGSESWAVNYALNVVCWYADIGASPASMTVTVDASAGNEFYSLIAFDVTGYDTGTPFAQASVDNAVGTSGGSGSNSLSLTLTLGSAPTSGNLVVAMFGAGADGGGGFAVPSGYSTLVNQDASYNQGAVFYHTSTTTAAVTCSDLGQTVGNGGGIIFEMTLAAEGGGDTELVVADAAHAHSADNTALVQAYALAVADATHAHPTDNVALLQAYLLAVADSVHTPESENVALEQEHLLAVADVEHTHTATQPALVQQFVLAVSDATHSHTSEILALTQAYMLTAVDAEHGHTSENVTISPDVPGDVQLAVADVVHDHASEQPALVQQFILSVDDVAHSHTAGGVVLEQAYQLTVADSTHGQAVDNVDLLTGLTLEVQEAAHGHAAAGPALLQGHVLAIDHATHSHTAESFSLAQAYTLAVAGSGHAHAVDSVVLAGGAAYQPAPTARRVLVYAADLRADVVTTEARTVYVTPDRRDSDA